VWAYSHPMGWVKSSVRSTAGLGYGGAVHQQVGTAAIPERAAWASCCVSAYPPGLVWARRIVFMTTTDGGVHKVPGPCRLCDGVRVSENVATWVNLPDVAERLGVPITKVHQLVKEGSLLAVRREGVLRVPAELVANDTVLKHLPGVLTLLRDAGYNDEEKLQWLYTADDTLPGTPAQALGGDKAREVKRRAQALAF
jgi:Rv2175c C-terminal domain of unknown function/DNA-binding protein Rv2175c, wHTH domain